MQKTERQLKRTTREMDRERTALERREKQIVSATFITTNQRYMQVIFSATL